MSVRVVNCPKAFLVLAAMALSTASSAQDPCALAGVGGIFDISERAVACRSGQTVLLPVASHEGVTSKLSAEIVLELRKLVSEVVGLRTDLKNHAASLAQARTKFDTSVKDTAAAQEAWRTQALEKVLSDIRKLPQELGADPGLREVLRKQLVADLLNDPTFVADVKQVAGNQRSVASP